MELGISRYDSDRGLEAESQWPSRGCGIGRKAMGLSPDVLEGGCRVSAKWAQHHAFHGMMMGRWP